MKKSISHQLNTPDKLAIFLQCKQFHELHTVHDYFIHLLDLKQKNDIFAWDQQQIQGIQNLSPKCTQKNNKVGILIWTEIYDQLIDPPLDPKKQK